MYRRTSFLVLTFILVIWEISVNFLHIPKFILPAPSLILYTCFSQAPLLLENTLVTAVEILLGLLISLAISLSLIHIFTRFYQRLDRDAPRDQIKIRHRQRT